MTEFPKEVDEAFSRLALAAPFMLEKLRIIAMLASCAPNDDEEIAGREFTKIMIAAQDAIAAATKP